MYHGAMGIRSLQRLFRSQPQQIVPRLDLHQIAIDTLVAKGTPFAAGLAMEIERGRRRGQDNYDRIRADLDHRNYLETEDREFMLTQLRPAEPGEYVEWFQGYFQAGGRSFRRHEYATPKMWVAVKHLDVRPLHGAKCLRIIVPEGIYDNGGDTGHTDLFIVRNGQYLQRGFHDRTARAPRDVYIYSDMDIEK